MIDMYNIYDRNILGYFKKFGKVILFINKKWTHNVYLKYIEIPITTRCSLNCKECSNLIQYYQKPYDIESNNIINDIYSLSKNVKGIKMLRILGGEPLLHPELAQILLGILDIKNIHNIQIVTNGTRTFDGKVLKIIRENHRITIDISNYEEKSIKRAQLIDQLEKNGITYYTQKERIFWTKQADISNRNRNLKQKENVLSLCTMDCISLLDGKVHLCPRSSHGMDLGIVEDCELDYVNVREKFGKEDLFRLLNTKSINACNYCDVYRWESLPETVAAEQISKSEAKEVLEKYRKK